MYQLRLFFFLGLLFTSLPACGGGEEGNVGPMESGPAGTASLAWDADSSFVSYRVHYGRESTGSVGSCNYEHFLDVNEPFATVTGLEFDTIYYFAVSAYNGLRSACSNEVAKAIEKPRKEA